MCLAPNAYLLITHVTVKLRKIPWFLQYLSLKCCKNLICVFIYLFIYLLWSCCVLVKYVGYFFSSLTVRKSAAWSLQFICPESHIESEVKASISQIHNFLSDPQCSNQCGRLHLFCVTMLIPVKVVYSKRYICSFLPSVVQSAVLRKFESIGKHETATQRTTCQG